MNPENPNLWNMDKGKTKEVLKFIHNLKEDPDWKPKQLEAFNEIIENCFIKNMSADAMLVMVGYRYKKLPTMYDIIESMV